MAPQKPSKSSTVLAVADHSNSNDPAKTTILHLREENSKFSSKFKVCSAKVHDLLNHQRKHETRERRSHL